MTLRNFMKYFGGLALAVVLLVWVFRGIDPHALWEQLLQVSPLGMAVCVVLSIGHNVFRVWRWQALLAPVQRDIPFRSMFVAVILGYMTSWIIPGRLGEIVRPLLLTGREDVPLGPCLGSVVADRLLDGAAVMVLFAVGAWITPLEGAALEHAGAIRAGAAVSAIAVVVVLGVMLVISTQSASLAPWVERRGKFLRWVGRTAISVSAGVSALRSFPLLVRIVVHSLLAWLTITVSIWAGVQAAGADVSIGAVMFIMPLLVLGVAVPTPGGAGSYEGLMKVGLMMFGASEVVAISAALSVHAAITVPIILLGMFLLWSEGIKWREIIAAAREFGSLGDAMDPAETSRVTEGAS